jgi:hypothetical protein
LITVACTGAPLELIAAASEFKLCEAGVTVNVLLPTVNVNDVLELMFWVEGSVTGVEPALLSALDDDPGSST